MAALFAMLDCVASADYNYYNHYPNQMTKHVAHKLQISTNTVDVHRTRILKKMKPCTLGKLIAESLYCGHFKEQLQEEFATTS